MRPPTDLTARPLPSITLDEAARAFMLWHTARVNPERRLDVSHAGRVEFWMHALGHKALDQITSGDVMAVRTWLAQRPKLEYRRDGSNGGKLIETCSRLSGSTINRHVAALASVYKYTHRHGFFRLTSSRRHAGFDGYMRRCMPTATSA